MAASGIEPVVKVYDTNGLPIVGAVLKVYQPGTTTYLPIFADSALTIPLANPLTGTNGSNANGWFPRFYLASGLYKMRAETNVGTLIWEYDNIDTGTSAGSGALPIASGGTGATTAAAARANLSAASTSDVTALAAQIATFTASLQNLISSPQGRLTPTTMTPVISTGAVGATALYYTPYTGDLCPIYNGTQFNLTAFSELTLTLSTNHLANTIYDVYLINDSVNGLTIVTGPAWNVSTAGSGARGAGGGTAEITRLQGLLVNANAMPIARNGAATYAVAANQGTFLGSIFIDATAGQITCNIGYGQSRKWAISNAYNRVPTFLKAGDSTASWSGSGTIFRASNGVSANNLTIFNCLAEEQLEARFSQLVKGSSSNSVTEGSVGIGFNSLTAPSGRNGDVYLALDSTTGRVQGNAVAEYLTMPSVIGVHVLTALECAPTIPTNTTYFGTETNMLLSAQWRA